jgi:hypothetical protein
MPSHLCPVELSAQSLHELACQAFRVGNRGRLSLCEALRALAETRLYLDLGFPSLSAYADAFFQLRRAEAFEYVRVAKRLIELTELREAFGQGRIGWSALKVITRVASVDSQTSWIDFAREHGVERTLAEARDALRRVGTRDGFVEVATEELERYEGCAEQTVIDGPTPARLRRQVLARDAGRCGNPRCHHRADHCHHIVFRSRGGKTKLANEVAVCTTCHALIHAGLLRVSSQAHGELRWLPIATRPSSPEPERLPVLQFVAEPAGDESSNADSIVAADHALDLDGLACGLMRLGVPAIRSRRIINAAIEALPSAETTEATVLRAALASL